jgi:hypothetical protein
MKCRLTLLQTNHPKRPLRTQAVEGWCDAEPREGVPFSMHAVPLDEAADIRMVTTSKVRSMVHALGRKLIDFQTENSSYRWEFLETEH